jgi:hypothetical protein
VLYIPSHIHKHLLLPVPIRYPTAYRSGHLKGEGGVGSGERGMGLDA